MANEFKIKKGLIVTGASGGTVVDIQGSQGQLFSVTDSLTGSIFAVSDISGVPIFDVNSSGLSTFDGLVSGITPVNAANFVTKAYADGLTPGVGVFLPIANPTFTGTLTGPAATITGNLNVNGNTFLGNASGDYTHVNDILHIGAVDSGDSDLYFGEGSYGAIAYGVHWDWDSGYTFTWNTRNNNTDTALMSYMTNDLTKVQWFRNFDMNNNKITELATPTATTDAANKAYVDASVPSLANYVTLTTAQTISGVKTFSANSVHTNDTHVTFGPNTTWGSKLRVGGNGHTATGTEMASVATTNGNLHLDSADDSSAMYLNYYAGTGGINFGNGADGIVATMTSAGALSINSDLTVSGGDITLGGTGRIQGVDTVSATTDATNKTYVDSAISTAGGAFLPKAGGVMSGKIGRSSAIVGFLEGSYNNVGDNSTNSNPIYTIGSSYNPASATLGNMYGIGYTHAGNASFITLTGAAGWGMYVASDGDARVWLDGGSGNISHTGDLYVGGGDIILAGTGRIQGIDTVSATTDAANKAYVDAHVTPVGTYLPLAGGTMANTNLVTNMNADLLDGISSASFLRSDATDTASQRISFNANATNNWDTIATASGSQGGIEIFNSGSGNDAFIAFHAGNDFAFYFGIDADNNQLSIGGWSMGANKYKVWSAYNDGAGSGLDADLLDGQQGSYYVNTATTQSVAGAKTFTTTPISVTRSTADNSTYLATTAFVKNQGYITGSYLPLAGGTMTGPLVNRRININRSSGAGGQLWYSSSYTSWQNYMNPGGAGAGYGANITAPTGTYVSSWALRSFIEGASGYGWTWEQGTASSTTPSIVAELSSSSGNFKTIGNIYASGGNSTQWNTHTSNTGTISSINATTDGNSLETSNTLTGNGTLTLAWQGNTASYVRGDGSLATFPSIPSVGNGQIDGRTSGNGLSGSMDATANQSGNTTFTVTSNATTGASANTIAYRDSSADISARLFRGSFGNQSTISGAMAFRVNNSSDNYLRYCSSPSAIRTFIGAASSSVVSGVTSIATTSPILGGTITGTGTLSLKVPVSGAWHNGGVAIVGAVTEIGRYIDFHTSNTGTSDFDIRLDANGSELNCSGNIRSQGNLEAVGNIVAGRAKFTSGTAALPSFSFTSDPDTGLSNPAANTIQLSTGGSYRWSVNNSATVIYQDVGIGVTPLAKFHVNGVSLVRGSTGVGDFYLGNVGTANHFRFHTNNSNTYFDMNCGNIYWRQGSSARYTFFPSTANMTVNGTITQNSDSRVKENVIEIGDCISKVQAMRGVYYNRTDFNTEVTKVGVIAQEVEAVLPELILEAPDTGLKSVAYSELTAVLINAIKEQQEIIEDLKTRITKLEK